MWHRKQLMQIQTEHQMIWFGNCSKDLIVEDKQRFYSRAVSSPVILNLFSGDEIKQVFELM